MPDELIFTQKVVNEDLPDVEKITFRLLGGDVRIIAESAERMLVTAFTLTAERALELERWLGERRRLMQNRKGY